MKARLFEFLNLRTGYMPVLPRSYDSSDSAQSIDAPTPSLRTDTVQSNKELLIDVPSPDFARPDPNLPDPTEFRQGTDKFTPPTSTSSPITSPTMSHHHTLHPTPVSGPPCPTSMKTPSNRKVSFTPVLPVYGAGASKPSPVQASTFFETYEKELTRLLEAGVDTKTAVSTAITLAQAEQNQPTATTDILQGTTNPYPTSTLQGVTTLPSIAHPGFIASTTVNPPSRGQQTPTGKTHNRPPPHTQGSKRSGRFDDWAIHRESSLDLGNFEEARKLRLMRSKLYGEAAEEFDTFKSVEFHNMKREPEENMRRYANRICKAFHKAYPMDGILDSATAASREQMMMDRFLEGLPSDVQVPLKYKKFASFETLIDRAELTALAIEESQTRVRIQAAHSSTNAPTHQNELTSVLETLNRLSTKIFRDICPVPRPRHLSRRRSTRPRQNRIPSKLQKTTYRYRDAVVFGVSIILPTVYQGVLHSRSYIKRKEMRDDRPVLAYPDFTKEFLIYTDSSDYGLGAVLSQMHDGKDQPITYASRHLNKAETKYSTIEKEAAAVIFGIKRFRHYLQDEPFAIISDHRPLQWLQTVKDDEENTDQIWAKEIELYGIAGGLLCRTQEPISKKRRRFAQQQVVVPFSLRKKLLNEYHDFPLSGHLAYQRTCLRIRDKYYWPTMLSDVKEYCHA
ncbi:Uncharacterized protein APZ42_031278 [Daphnia magna]|uniref:RNA-directed DNA polymerase n=1 Tax=Daphnia magna TaxID=35525 RepID=A0A164MZ90_9CRUS|nr:Uncharacterized protein APZ42_031278 [Daphnia magna]